MINQNENPISRFIKDKIVTQKNLYLGLSLIALGSIAFVWFG